MKKFLILSFVFLIITGLVLSAISISRAQEEHKISVLNEADPGSRVDLEEHIVPNKINVVDFYADWCGPCRNIAPYLEALDNNREDVVVLKVNIDNWDSPVCQQYKINSVPSFLIYDEEGNLTFEGEEAWNEVIRMLEELES